MVLLWPAITLIFSMRILIEFVKINQVAFEEGMKLNMGQILSIPLY
jgi:prolipoprotein diacylglyceryltransferase